MMPEILEHIQTARIALLGMKVTRRVSATGALSLWTLAGHILPHRPQRGVTFALRPFGD